MRGQGTTKGTREDDPNQRDREKTYQQLPEVIEQERDRQMIEASGFNEFL